MSTVDRVDSLSYASSVVRTLAHFVALRRIWMTLCLLLAADAVLGTLARYDFTNVREIGALMGLVSVLVGLFSFINAAEERLVQNHRPERRGDPSVEVYLAGFATVLGFCLFAVYPKNGWFVLAPFFLLYVRRVWLTE